MQLRAAAHLGPVDHDGHGFVGTDVDFLFRMLDARPLKHALASTGADLALVVSEYVYRNIVFRHPSLVSPAVFRPIRVQVKYTRTRAWTYLPSALGALGQRPIGLPHHLAGRCSSRMVNPSSLAPLPRRSSRPRNHRRQGAGRRELISGTQDRLRRVTTFVPDELTGRGTGETMRAKNASGPSRSYSCTARNTSVRVTWSHATIAESS
jgi:hypothetical protein